MRAHLNSEPEQNGSNGDHSQKVDPTLFVAGGHLPELLETIDQAFDGIALPTLTLAVVVTYSAPNDDAIPNGVEWCIAERPGS